MTVRQSVENPFAPIAARRTPQVVGALFKDVNGNGTTDNGEVRLPGYVIYVDKDDDGRLDANEPRFTTNERGTFYIFDLALGPVRLRYVPQPGDGLAGNSIMADIQAAGNQRFTVFGARLES